MKRFIGLVAAFAVGLAIPAMAQIVRVGGQAMLPTKMIVGNAVNSADHTTLVTAVKAAGLVDTLNGPGPFTVFAPVNAAFAELPALMNGPANILIRDDKAGVADITILDVNQSNGVIHVIDKVLMP